MGRNPFLSHQLLVGGNDHDGLFSCIANRLLHLEDLYGLLNF